MIHLDFEGDIQTSAFQVNIIKWMLNKFDSVIDIPLRREQYHRHIINWHVYLWGHLLEIDIK